MDTQPRILIADDDSSSVRLLEAILRRAGYEDLAGTTDARVVRPLFTEFRPDLVLLDMHMPHMDGFEIIAGLREHLGSKGMPPVMLITGDVTPALRRKALVGGVDDFMLKPFQNAEVLLHVQHLLEKRCAYLASVGESRVIPDPAGPARRVDPEASCLVELPVEILPVAVPADAGIEARLLALRALLETAEQLEALEALAAALEGEPRTDLAAANF